MTSVYASYNTGQGGSLLVAPFNPSGAAANSLAYVNLNLDKDDDLSTSGSGTCSINGIFHHTSIQRLTFDGAVGCHLSIVFDEKGTFTEDSKFESPKYRPTLRESLFGGKKSYYKGFKLEDPENKCAKHYCPAAHGDDQAILNGKLIWSPIFTATSVPAGYDHSQDFQHAVQEFSHKHVSHGASVDSMGESEQPAVSESHSHTHRRASHGVHVSVEVSAE